MLNLIIRYLTKNKKRTFVSIFGITLASFLLISIGILFSSFHHYLVYKVESEIGDYHVIIDGNLKKYNDYSILNIKYKESRYYIKFNNIKKVYDNTEKICFKRNCNSITYNNQLLSLYGLGKNNLFNTFKQILIVLVCLLSFATFLIVYNSFKISLNSRKRQVALLKAIGVDNYNLYKLFFFESLVIAIFGLILGFMFSIVFCKLLIYLVNHLLFELFNNELCLSFYFEFIFIPFLFIVLIIIFSSLLPLKNIKKYKVMQLFKDDDICYKNIKFNSKIPFERYLAYLNFKRNNIQYRSVIVCIFISVLLFNCFSLVLTYGIKSIKEYVKIPSYDLVINVDGKDYNKLNDIASDIGFTKKNNFRFCEFKTHIPRENYLKNYKDSLNVILTDFGGNKIINNYDEIDESSKIMRSKYKRFKNLKKIVLDDFTLSNLSLSDEVPFGFTDFVNKDNIVINVSSSKFDELCFSYKGALFLKTNYKGLDKYLDNLIKNEDYKDIAYMNVKKAREIINNIVLSIELFLYGITFLVIIISISSVVNIVSTNISFRNKEFAKLKSLGLCDDKIIMSLFWESLIIVFKGWLYTVPFIFLFDKFLYDGIKEVIDFKGIIVNYDILFLSLIVSLFVVFLSIAFTHYKLKSKSLIKNIIDTNI